MKKLIFIALIILPITAYNQNVELNFIHFRNDEVKDLITKNLPRFTKSLKECSINDTISINYDMRRNSVFIMHNIIDPDRIYIVYVKFLMHCAFLKSVAPIARLEFTKILVQHLNNRYLEADYSDLVAMTGTRRARWYVANYRKNSSDNLMARVE